MIWEIFVNRIVYAENKDLVQEYRKRMGHSPNVACPKLPEEKYLWRKIFDRNPLFATLTDKLLSKEYAKKTCPGIKIPHVIWQGVDFNEIPDSLLMRPAILKSNHASKQMIFLDGKDIDRSALKNETDEWLSRPYGVSTGEWAYLNIDRKIFLEDIIEGKDGAPLIEFNAFVFDGVVQHIQCLRDSEGANPTTSRYDRCGRQLEPHYSPKFTSRYEEAPPQFPAIISTVERLGAGFDHVRCDVYLRGDDIYFSEMTFYPNAGFPNKHDPVLRNDWKATWDLRGTWFLTTPQKGWRAVYANRLRKHLRSV
jgi:hypothetical protein